MTSPHYDANYVRATEAAIAVRRVSALSVQNRPMEGGHENEPQEP
jgi:hypothetical protein